MVYLWQLERVKLLNLASGFKDWVERVLLQTYKEIHGVHLVFANEKELWNTLLIDDIPHMSMFNLPFNAIFLEKFFMGQHR